MNSRFRWVAALLLLTLWPARPAAAQTWLSAVSVSVSNSDPVGQSFQPLASVSDSVGNKYVTGAYRGTFSLDGLPLTGGFPRSAEVFVGKLNPAGVWQWVVRTQSLTPDTSNMFSFVQSYQIALDANGDVVFAGTYTGRFVMGADTLSSPPDRFNAFVGKLSPAGAWQWVSHSTIRDSAGYNGCGASTLATSPDGSIYLAGSVRGAVAFGRTTLVTAPATGVVNVPEAYVAKLSSAGTWQWAAVSSGSTWDGIYLANTTVNSIVVDSAGNATVLGYFSKQISFGRHTLTRIDTSSTAGDLFVSRISPTGDWQWATAADSRAGRSIGGDMALTPTGALVLTGLFYGTTSFGGTALVNPPSAPYGTAFLASMTAATGDWEWAVLANGAPNDTMSYGQRVRVVAGGNILLTGAAASARAGSVPLPQPFVALYSATGTPLWRTQIPLQAQPFTFTFHDIRPTAPDEVQLIGAFTDTATFGAFTISTTTASTSGLYIARLSTRPLSTRAEIQATSFTLAPNPAHDAVQLTGTASPAMLLDALGRTVRTYPAGATTFSLRGLVPGLYTVRAGGAARRLVVE